MGVWRVKHVPEAQSRRRPTAMKLDVARAARKSSTRDNPPGHRAILHPNGMAPRRSSLKGEPLNGLVELGPSALGPQQTSTTHASRLR